MAHGFELPGFELPADGVYRLSGCSLRAAAEPWPFAITHSTAIATHWEAALARNPRYFKGVIHVMTAGHLAGADGVHMLDATLTPITFDAFLYWREAGFSPSAGARDIFGSALLRAECGAVILGRAAAHTLNAGSAYLPGGFIDPRDVAADGSIDIAASTARELREETGLDPAALTIEPGAWLTLIGPQVSIAVTFRAAVSAAALVGEIRAARQSASDGDELTDLLVVRTVDDLADPSIAPYARMLLSRLL